VTGPSANTSAIKSYFSPLDTRIAVVGCGYIGTVIAAVLAERGFVVTGIDRDPSVRHSINTGVCAISEPGLDKLVERNAARGRLQASDDFSRIADCAVVLITVDTPLSPSGEADLSRLGAAVESCAPFVSDDHLVIIKSTVPPNTTAEFVAPVLRRNATPLIAFSPERLAEGQALSDFTSIPIVAGGIDDDSTKAAGQFWRAALGLDIIEVRDSCAAELVKLADNLWIDLNIALANDLAKLSDKLDTDVLEVIRAANTLSKGGRHVNILEPSMGVGGSCLTKDPWFVDAMAKRLGVEMRTPKTSRGINDSMPDYAVDLINELLLSNGRVAANCRVAVLGLAFKSNTGDCRFTPTKPAIAAMAETGYSVVLHDPLVSAADAAMVSDLPLEPDLETAITGADCIAFFTGHDAFRRLPMARIAELANPGALIFDGRIQYGRDQIEEIKLLGLRYKGIGR